MRFANSPSIGRDCVFFTSGELLLRRTPGPADTQRRKEMTVDELIELAHKRSRISGENAAEELMQLLLRSGAAEEIPASAQPTPKGGRCDGI